MASSTSSLPSGPVIDNFTSINIDSTASPKELVAEATKEQLEAIAGRWRLSNWKHHDKSNIWVAIMTIGVLV
jgi:hypothetical protein